MEIVIGTVYHEIVRTYWSSIFERQILISLCTYYFCNINHKYKSLQLFIVKQNNFGTAFCDLFTVRMCYFVVNKCLKSLKIWYICHCKPCVHIWKLFVLSMVRRTYIDAVNILYNFCFFHYSIYDGFPYSFSVHLV